MVSASDSSVCGQPVADSHWESATGEPCCPPPGLAEVSQAEAISNAVMAQMSAMMAAFQAQISDLAKVNFGSSMLSSSASSSVAEATLTSSMVTEVAMVKPPGGLVHSSVEAMASTVRRQLTCVESEGEVPHGEFLSVSSP